MFMKAKILHSHPFVMLSIGLDALYSSFAMAEQSRIRAALSPELIFIEPSQVNNIVLLALIFGAGLCLDKVMNDVRRRHQQTTHQARIETVHRTMATVHHVVNNGLNNLLLIHMEAKKNQPLSPETLIAFEGIIEETAVQLRKIDALEIAGERTLGPDLKTFVLSTT